MCVRRGRATARLGAGLLLSVACAAAPALVLAGPTAPAGAEVTPTAQCEVDAQPTASATSTELGGSVEVTGDCFPTRSDGTIEIFIQENDDSRQVVDDLSTE